MAQPLLSDGLSEAKRVALASLKQHPGFAVLEELFMAACSAANEDVIKLSPEDEGYERKLKARQMKARERNEFSLLVLKSVEYHTQFTVPVKQEPEQQENRIVKAPKLPIKDVAL